MKRWVLRRNKVNTKRMAEVLNLQEATACVLANRGIATVDEVLAFFRSKKKSFLNPLLMKDMQRIIDFLKDAIDTKQKITIYGDYDVDGVTGTTILFRTLQRCGAVVSFCIPHRQKDGYGLNMQLVEELAATGTNVLLTCDNGIAAHSEITRAKELGMSVLVLDHHEPHFCLDENGNKKELLPPADAILDPKQQACPYPFLELCAAGIAFKLSVLFLHQMDIRESALEQELMTLAGIATVCDMVPLREENRLLVRYALEYLPHTQSIGLSSLLQEAKLTDQAITEYHIGFILGPCINAAGRLSHAELGVTLLCETDPKKATDIAQQLVQLNEERKLATQVAFTDCVNSLPKPLPPILVLYNSNIPESVAGIVAGRIKDDCYRPVILLTQSESIAKGSARSITGYHIFNELLACQDLFLRFGGHAMAAGLSMPMENIDILRERMTKACTLTEESLSPVIRIEKVLSFSEITFTLIHELSAMAPFGKGNPRPIFATQGIRIKQFRYLGKDQQTLKLVLSEEKTDTVCDAIFFRGVTPFVQICIEAFGEEEWSNIQKTRCIPACWDVAYQIEKNTYNGSNSIQLILQDIRFSHS